MRRNAHNSAIDACSIINRLCDIYGCDHICPDTNDRYIIADFIGSFVYNVYLEGQGNKTFDQVVEAARDLKADPNHAVDECEIGSDEEWDR